MDYSKRQTFGESHCKTEMMLFRCYFTFIRTTETKHKQNDVLPLFYVFKPMGAKIVALIKMFQKCFEITSCITV